MRSTLLMLLLAVASFAGAYFLWPVDNGAVVPQDPIETAGEKDPVSTQSPTQPIERRTEVTTTREKPKPGIAVVRVLVCNGSSVPIAGCRVQPGKQAAKTTDENGIAEFELRPGRHWIEVQPEDARAGAVLRQRVTATVGEIVEVRAVLVAEAGGQIWCRVVAADTNLPIEGAHVMVYPYGEAEAVTDAEGLVAVEVAGDYEFLVAHAEGRAMRRVVPVAKSFGEDGVIEVPLAKAADLSITAVDAAGEPVPDCLCTVTAMPWSLVYPQGAPPRGMPEVWTAQLDERGVCGFADLPPTVPLVVTVAPPAGTAAAATQTFELAPGPNQQRIQLTSLGNIVGRVLDAGGTPIPSARVAAVQMHGDEALTELAENVDGLAALTEADGTFELKELDPGTWALAVQATQGWVSPCLRVEVLAGETARIDLKAQRALSIAGRLTGPGNRPISAFEVHAMKGDTLVASAVTDRDGLFTIESLADGEYEITTELYDQDLAMREPVRVRAGRTGLEVKVAAVNGSLRGRAKNAFELRPDTFVRGFRRSGREVVAGRVDLDGRFEYGRLREGTWDFVAYDGDGSVGVAHGVVVKAQASTDDVVVELARGGVVRPMHPLADAFAVVRGEDVAMRGPLERGLPGEAAVPSGAWTVEFYVRGRAIARREVAVVAGQQVVVDGK
ncbi:MAG: carboxypeptidase-like regulatory domain-containing protein [Planctomycetota bacterium]